MKRFLYFSLLVIVSVVFDNCKKDYELMPGHGNSLGINGIFSVSSSKKVYFSRGNLQYQASTNTWRFALNQWDLIGDANKNISSSYSGWIDLFGWGTGNNPTKTSTDNSDYSSFSDWGNKVGNDWRTLTIDEWKHLFQERSEAASKYGHGNVNGVYGMILLPDSWTLPSGLNFIPGESSWSNVYTAEQWLQMETNGAVFLPAAGYRKGTSVHDVDHYGYYWSATHCNSNSAWLVLFREFLPSTINLDCSYGRSVRLVAPAEN